MTDDEFRALVAQGPATVMVSKADMLRLLDDRDDLRERVALAEMQPRDQHTMALGYRAERDAARADVARLREALTEIAWPGQRRPVVPEGEIHEIAIAIAHAALAAAGGEARGDE